MTPYEEELLTKYLTHLNVVDEDGDFADFADFEELYQLVATPTATAPRVRWKRHQSCATRTSCRPPGSSTNSREIQNCSDAGHG